MDKERRTAPSTDAVVRRRFALIAAMLVASTLFVIGPAAGRAAAVDYVPVSGAGSTWSENALSQWITDTAQYGMRINYQGDGSSAGRQAFLDGTVDFAASDIPFQPHPDDGSNPENPAPNSYAYMPITAGGTVFMYNLIVNGQRVTNLRLSGLNITKIFTGVITNWDDPALAADNPGLTLPDRAIVPVVRSDGSGSTAQFTLWMISQYPALWSAYCNKTDRAPACGETSVYPTGPISGMIAQSGDLGVAGYVAQGYADGAIGYVNYSYALNAEFPVAKMLNAAGYYTEPTPENVAVSLLAAQIDTADVNDPSKYLTQQLGGVYTDPDPRSYPLSSYSYLILPTIIQGQFTVAKGLTLGAFSYYAMCQGQQQSASLGYSPMPVNLVEAAFGQIPKIPGAQAQTISIQTCNNPTFNGSGQNLLATEDPAPPPCDKQSQYQCPTGTGGDHNATTIKPSAIYVAAVTTTGGGNGSGGSGGGSTGSGSTTGGTAARLGTNTATGSNAAGGSSSSGITGGAGTAAGTSATPSVTTALGTGSAGPQVCDPATGVCTGGGTSTAGTGTGSGNNTAAAQIAASPITLAVSHGWGSTQTLMLLIGLLLLVLILAPGLAYRYLSRRGE